MAKTPRKVLAAESQLKTSKTLLKKSVSDKSSYTEHYEIINAVIQKFQKKWQLKAIAWFDFEDVAQMVKLHIYKKWHMWDETKPLEPWIARITSNQIKNIIRNNYTNYVRPCMSCEFNMGGTLCAKNVSGNQEESCADYAKWSKLKKIGYGIKMPLSIENHLVEVDSKQDSYIHFDSSLEELNKLMRECLSKEHYTVYVMLFLEKKSEEDVADFMGYKTNEKNRKAGYKQIKNLKNMLKNKAKEIIYQNDVIK